MSIFDLWLLHKGDLFTLSGGSQSGVLPDSLMPQMASTQLTLADISKQKGLWLLDTGPINKEK